MLVPKAACIMLYRAWTVLFTGSESGYCGGQPIAVPQLKQMEISLECNHRLIETRLPKAGYHRHECLHLGFFDSSAMPSAQNESNSFVGRN